VLKHPQKFTSNKQVVRDLQCATIHEHLSDRLGQLSYFGLPSSSLEDVAQWNPFLKRIIAVERGEPGREWVVQNELLLNAFRLGFSAKLTLLRGDIDQILITGADQFGNKPDWPFDIVSLDYSGGLFYRDPGGRPLRLEAISQLFRHQADARASHFVFFLSFNLDHIDQHEVRESIKRIGRDLQRFGKAGDKVIEAYLQQPREEPRLKLYVMNLVAQLASQSRFDSVSESPVFYCGNRGTDMMAFRFLVKSSPRTFAPGSPRERLNAIVNRRMIKVIGGKQSLTNLGLPLIKRDDTGTK
jgi:hypothetical protein